MDPVPHLAGEPSTLVLLLAGIPLIVGAKKWRDRKRKPPRRRTWPLEVLRLALGASCLACAGTVVWCFWSALFGVLLAGLLPTTILKFVIAGVLTVVGALLLKAASYVDWKAEAENYYS